MSRVFCARRYGTHRNRCLEPLWAEVLADSEMAWRASDRVTPAPQLKMAARVAFVTKWQLSQVFIGGHWLCVA
jgi:hypothetical protein